MNFQPQNNRSHQKCRIIIMRCETIKIVYLEGHLFNYSILAVHLHLSILNVQYSCYLLQLTGFKCMGTWTCKMSDLFQNATAHISINIVWGYWKLRQLLDITVQERQGLYTSILITQPFPEIGLRDLENEKCLIYMLCKVTGVKGTKLS